MNFEVRLFGILGPGSVRGQVVSDDGFGKILLELSVPGITFLLYSQLTIVFLCYSEWGRL